MDIPFLSDSNNSLLNIITQYCSISGKLNILFFEVVIWAAIQDPWNEFWRPKIMVAIGLTKMTE